MGRPVIRKRNKKYLRARNREIVRVWIDVNTKESDHSYRSQKAGAFDGNLGWFARTPEAEALSRKYNLPISSIDEIGHKGYMEIITRAQGC